MSVRPQPNQRLIHDHQELDSLLKALQQALNDCDLEATYARLDHFWARLAVHIRAEHLHVFPAVIARLSRSGEAVRASLTEAQSTVDLLRADHDFFMVELARAMASLRDLMKGSSCEAHQNANDFSA